MLVFVIHPGGLMDHRQFFCSFNHEGQLVDQTGSAILMTSDLSGASTPQSLL